MGVQLGNPIATGAGERTGVASLGGAGCVDVCELNLLLNHMF